MNEKGKFGNPVGIVVDEKKEINPQDRQRITARLGFSESVFINNINTGTVSIFNPKKEVDFAGHALVGTAYFITNSIDKPFSFLECRGGHILTWQENETTWIRASLKNTPPWYHEQLHDPSFVEKLSISHTTRKKHTMVWAWLDQNKGIVRARTFAPDWGIPEDQANGSGSMQLAVLLNQNLEIHHGEGSVIYAKSIKTGYAAVGGRVVYDMLQEVIV